MKEFKFLEGWEIDPIESNDDKIVIKRVPRDNLTRAEIQVENQRLGKKQFYVTTNSEINSHSTSSRGIDRNLVPTLSDASRIIALSQALVIAEYYNKGWEYADGENVYVLRFNCRASGVEAYPSPRVAFEPIFKDKETAEKAYNANKEIFDTLLKV
jgi:hypothetical protein